LTLIKIQGLTHRFDKAAVLQQVNLQLAEGQLIGVVGPDGAGKTTLLRLMAALLQPTAGRIAVLGKDTVREAEAIHGFTGYMPQRFGLYEDLTVLQNMKLYAALRGADEAIFDQLFHFTGLKPFQDRLAFALSGGMKQKLGLACALVSRPKVLILDEPSVGVDPISRRELWEMVQALLHEHTSVIWSTTYLDEAAKCDRIVFLDEGRVLYEGVPQALTRQKTGKVFLLRNGAGNRREHLAEVVNLPDVVDALIQGDAIRVVAKGTHFPGKKVEARLEDAFVAMLGGAKKGEPLVSQKAPVTVGNGNDVIKADKLVKKFGSFTAVGGISFTVKRGEIFGLLGPNGAGKSTTFKMLCGLLKPTAGRASINGFDLQTQGVKARQQLGYMAQKFSLYGNLTVRQNLAFFSGVYPVEGTMEEKLKIFDLEKVQDVLADELPLGIKQKLGLAAAMLHWPDVLFLDEPTSGMDPVSRREFWAQMNGLVRKGKTILVSTHFMDEAENCDRIGLVYQGKMIHLGTPAELKGDYPNLEEAFIQLIKEAT
jgi:ABC-2 type transport system ATP-binding protein